MAVPKLDSELFPWSANFAKLAQERPEVYHLAPETVAQYVAAHEAYAAAYQAAANPKARSSSLVSARRAVKVQLLELARSLYGGIAASLDISDADKGAIGVNVRRPASPVPPPDVAPFMNIVSVAGNLVTVRLRDGVPGKRRRLPGAAYANLYTFVGENPPNNTRDWTYLGATAKTTHTIAFDMALPPGTVVWVTACWLNRRAQPGPPANPVSAYIEFGMRSRAAA
jgi:hypothetical protein